MKTAGNLASRPRSGTAPPTAWLGIGTRLRQLCGASFADFTETDHRPDTHCNGYSRGTEIVSRQPRRPTTRTGRNSDAIEIVECSRENLAIAAMRADQAQQHGAAALAREAMRGYLALVFVNDRIGAFNLDGVTDHLPVVLIVYDNNHSTTRPDGRACLDTVVSPAACAVVHAAGATAETYLEAASARVTGACALIEANAAFAKKWAQTFISVPTIAILPRDGMHPAKPGTIQ